MVEHQIIPGRISYLDNAIFKPSRTKLFLAFHRITFLSMSGDKVQKLNSEIQKVRQQISDCQRELKDEIFNGLNQGNGRLSPQGIGLFYSFCRTSPG